MHTLKKILVPVDGSDYAFKAVEFAAGLALNFNAEIHLIHIAEDNVVPQAILDFMRSEGIHDSPTIINLRLLEGHIIDPAETEARNLGVKRIKRAVLSGDPAEKIVTYAKDHDLDLIVMGSKGEGESKGKHLGSVASKVSNTSDRSCVTIRKDILDGVKVLIVDDEPDVLETLEELLLMCHITKAKSYKEAKKALENEKFDIAVLDIMGVDGYKLLDLSIEKDTIPVMLTANALSPKDTIKSLEKGAASYIPKDEMVNISTYLKDILEAKEKGEHFWWRWLDRFGAYYTKKFGADWNKAKK